MTDPAIATGDGPLVAPLPFSDAEYDRRLAAIRRDMAAAGLDAFVAFGPENINWLTGHDTPAYQYLQACVVTPGADPVNLLRSIDASNTLLRSRWRRAVAYADHEDPVVVLAGLLRALLPAGARIGLEDRAFFVGARRCQALVAALDGFTVEGRHLVEVRRLVKSREELAILRSAGRITAGAMAAAVATAGVGVSENAIAAAVWSALVTAGGEFPGLPPFIVSGPRSSLGHATWSGRILAPGDVLNFEIPGVLARYCAPLFRTGTVGPVPAEVRAVEAACHEALDALTAGLRPGACLGDLHRQSVAIFARHGLALAHRSGYSVGVNYAPDWGEGDILSIVEGEARPAAEGMVFHLVPGVYVPGRFAVVVSETVAVGSSGAERIVDFPAGVFSV